MSRRVPWDDLPRSYPFEHKTDESQRAVDVPMVEMVEQRNLMKDLTNIGRRVAFGVVCGSMIGATFGIVDILRDVKAISTKKSIAIAKVTRYSAIFAVFFGTYHGTRKVLKLTLPLTAETNLIIAGTLCVSPMLFHRALRPMAPYSVMLVAIDAINGLYDI